jgi:hypothetical protein
MEQSVITSKTAEVLFMRAEAVVNRELTDLEKALVEYALDQVRLGLVNVA